MTQTTAETEAPDAVEVQDAVLNEVPQRRNHQGTGKIDLLLETSVDVSAVLGSVRMPIGELLRMGTGSVLTLDREAGQPVDLLLNGIPFAKGHLVVVGDRLGIRLTEVETPDDGDEEAEADGGGASAHASDGG